MKNIRFLVAFMFIWIPLCGHYLDGIQAVIFDCDGVLVDSEYLKFCAWREALAEHHVDFLLEDYMPMVGYSLPCIFDMICNSKHTQLPLRVIDSRRAAYEHLQSRGVVPLQPMVDFVRELWCTKSGRGLKLALASSVGKKEILVNLECIKLADVFEVIVSGEDDLGAYCDQKEVNKPKPYIYLEVAKQLCISPAHCLVFEDTSAGVVAAVDAGMCVIAVPNRYTMGQDFSRATRVIHALAELDRP